jgi:hypothetical protein
MKQPQTWTDNLVQRNGTLYFVRGLLGACIGTAHY